MAENGSDTPHVPLSVVLARRDLALSTLVEVGDPPITWAVAGELVEPAAYLRGGELLLTAGVNLPDTTNGVRSYVASLVGVGVSAVGFGMAPVHETVPARLIEQCGLQGLPLLEVPPVTPFAAISRAVGEELGERHLRDLRRLGESHQALARTVTTSSPVDRLLAVLADTLGGWAALTPADPIGPAHRTNGAPTRLAPELRTLVTKLTASSGPRSAKVRSGPDEVFLHTVGASSKEGEVLLVGRPDSLDITDRAVLRTAISLLELLRRARDERVTADPGAALVALLLDGALNPGAVGVLAELTHTSPPASAETLADYRVLRATPVARGPHTAVDDLPLGTRLVDRVPFVEGAQTIVRAILADRTEGAHHEYLDRLRSHGWIGALSRAMPVEDLADADREAASLLVRARAMEEPLLWTAESDLFDTLLGSESVARLSRETLGPLTADTSAARTLRTTLRAWLARHGNWDRTAADLGVHRNSVRYRIGRIERDLGVDLADPERRMRLWFALTRRPEHS